MGMRELFVMRRRLSAIPALLAFAVLLAGPAVARADNGLPSTRSHPDLITALAISPSQAEACFDKPLATTFNINDGNTRLVGYTEYRQTGPTGPLRINGTPTIDPGNANCAVINFTGPGDVRTFSRLEMDVGAVTGTTASGGLVNMRGSQPLIGSIIPPQPGVVAQPTLNGVTVDAPNGNVTYTFAQPVQNVNAGSLGFYTNNPTDLGTFHFGSALVGFQAGANSVTVHFSSIDAPQLPQATRFVAQQNAVQNAFFQGNPPGAVAAPGTNGATTRPDLAIGGGRTGIVVPSPPTVSGTAVAYTFLFDKPVTVVDATQFALYDATGAKFTPNVSAGIATSPDGHQITMQFSSSDPKADPSEITLETVNAGAVVTQGTATTNTEGSAPLAAPADHIGLTSGPDLLAWSIDRSNFTVTLTFDEVIPKGNVVNSTVPSAIGPIPAIAVFDNNGTLTAPAGDSGLLGIGSVPSISQNQNLVILHYGNSGSQASAIQNAIGVSLAEGAVTDAQGVANPEIAYGQGQGPALPSPPGVPNCSDQNVSTAFNTAVTIDLSCSVPSGASQTFRVVTQPQHGTLSGVAGSSQVTYTPNNGYSGPDSFTFSANDSAGAGNVATVNLTVAASPPPTTPRPCRAAPHSSFDRGATHASTRGITLAGSSRPGSCANENSSDAARLQVAIVRVEIYQVTRGGQCRFMGSNGGLTHARDCSNPILLRARGTDSWSLSVRGRIAKGTYHARVAATDVGHDREGLNAFLPFRVR